MKQLLSARLKFHRKIRILGAFLVLIFTLSASHAQSSNPFEGGWSMIPEASSLTFQTIKNGSKLETSSFASFDGTVDEDGNGEIRIQLDSVDTKVDLRNVRMRFLFFETFKFKEATVSTIVDPVSLKDLELKGRITMPLIFVLDLHGLSQALETSVVVTLLADGKVSVSSASPISIATELFGLDEGVRKLEEAANVSIVPMGTVSFNLIFLTGKNAPKATPAAVETTTVATSASVAVETTGELSSEECAGRFEILSRTGGIYFGSGSAELDPESQAVLDTVINIIERCADMNLLIAGHTDSAGSDEVNQWLSEERALSVLRFLNSRISNTERIQSTGFGESRPVAPNDTPRNRGLNRRIEFIVN